MLWRSSKVMEGRSMPCWSTAILTRCLKAQVTMTMSMNREMGCSFIIMREGLEIYSLVYREGIPDPLPREGLMI